MTFVYTLDGQYIALSEVERAEPQKDGFRIFLRSGQNAAISDHAWGEVLRADIKGILPAPSGYVVVERLTEDDGADVIHREPVLGWAVLSSGSVLPITAGGISVDEQNVLVPDGRVMQGDGWFDDLAAWEASRRS
ncbi:MAG: hypothetical protein K0M78_02285 [Brevundimonas sp.]|nr:hypothetical protein [Brevundimonas sp.]